MKIIFKNLDGGVAVFTPTQEALEALSMEEIAQRVVPAPYRKNTAWDENSIPTEFEMVKTPYWIVDPSITPSDRTFRDAWEIDETALGEPHGFGGEE